MENDYQRLIEILKTKEFPENYLDIRQELLDGLRMEMSRRITNIVNTPRFNRRDHSGKYCRFRKEVIKRDGKTCVECGKKITKKLQVAHILPVELFPDLAFEVWNGQVKCEECHKKEKANQYRMITERINKCRMAVWKLS